MNIFKKVEAWGDTHQSKWLAVFRVLLGLIIFFKGLYFGQNSDALHQIISKSAVSLYAIYMINYVAMVQLVGGVLIAIGLITRGAIIFLIPIVAGAIIFVNAQNGFYSVNSELWLSILVLAMLLFFLVFGSGKYSVDEFMRTHVNT